MYFKESEQIARTELFPRCDIAKIDRFLAREYVSCFKLHDVIDKAYVCENVEAILDEFTNFRVVKPAIRYFCPTHKDEALKLRKSLIVTRKGHCHRCGKAHLLQGLETENYYRRIKTPGSWSNGEAFKSQSPDHQREPPLWKDRRLHIAIISASIVALVGAAVGLFIHFNPVYTPEPSQLVTPTVEASATTVSITSPLSAARSATPAITITATYPPTAAMTPIS